MREDMVIVDKVMGLAETASEGSDVPEAIADLTSALCTVIAFAGMKDHKLTIASRVAELIRSFPYEKVLDDCTVN